MRSSLVAYYSLSGHTAKVAEAIAAALPADLERIRDAKSGFFGTVQAVYEGALRTSAVIASPEKRAADYDLVVLGCPVWAQRMASPMRAYIRRERGDFKRIALFCTLGGAGGEATIREMTELCGRIPVASLILPDKDRKPGKLDGRIESFVRQIRVASSAGTGASAA